jgi:unsaturated chondroitin disaccharide hydrolase
MRSLRSLALGHVLGQRLMEEQDAAISLLDRLLDHARTTAQYNVYFGRGRDAYDVRGRTAHESLFNVASGTYRGPSTQQGYSPFTTWTRGLAWAMLGFAEQLEFLATLPNEAPDTSMLLEAATAACDHYIDDVTAADGIPYWDAGAPGLAGLADWRDRAADPFNDREPVDSSAAAIAAQGLLRLARVLDAAGRQAEADLYQQAGLRVAETLFEESGPYLSVDPKHQGLLLHSVYHWPNKWDHVPAGSSIPRGESSQWGDYHARELALYLKRLADGEPYLAFFGS